MNMLKTITLCSVLVLMIAAWGCSGQKETQRPDQISDAEAEKFSDQSISGDVQNRYIRTTEEGYGLPERLDPLEVPLCLFNIWVGSEWRQAVTEGEMNGRDLLQREFSRLSATGATLLMNNLANQRRQLEAYNNGNLLPSLALDAVPTPLNAPLAVADVMDPRIPDERGTGWNLQSYSTIITRFAMQRNMRDPRERAVAFALIDETVREQQEAFMDEEGFAAYHLLDEGWGRNGTAADNDDYSVLFEYAVDKIREKDRRRPIIMINDYVMLERWSIQDPRWHADPHFVDEVLAGDKLAGWNIWLQDHYPFTIPPGSYQDRLEAYYGPDYYRMMYITYLKLMSQLTPKVESYAAGVHPVGPKPEWWSLVQAHRLEKTVDGERELFKRRPTYYEFGLQLYMSLAAGAKGVGFYAYNSSAFSGVYETLDGETVEFPSDRESQGTHGLITSDMDGEAGFRTPLSEVENQPDYFSEGTMMEPYPGEHYPFDRVRDAFMNMRELLPILRPLEWQGAHDGLNNSYFDTAGSGDQIWHHLSIKDAMGKTQGALSRRPMDILFRLRAIDGDKEAKISDWRERYSSNIAVGMFTDPSEPGAEYYLLVNMEANRNAGGYIAPAEEQTTITLLFEGDDPLEAELVWQDRNRDTRPLEEASRLVNGGWQLELPLLPADAKLLRVR